MKQLKIIILSGSIYPYNSPRSFRATELAKGFVKQGHDVTLYSILGDFNYSSFEKETGVRIKGMGKSYFGNLNSDTQLLSDSKLFRFYTRIVTRLFRNIIDYPRVEFFFKALNVLKNEINFDYLITVAHPYGLHWGTAYFKKFKNRERFKVWVSDCGDPFMGSTNSQRKEWFLKPLEKFWGTQTDFITIPTETSKVGYYKEVQDKIEIIPQSIDFESIHISQYKKNIIPTFIYSGVVYPGKRDPTKLLEYLCSLNFDFKFIVYVPNDIIFGDFKSRLKDKLVIKDYIPRLQLINELSKMDFLINLKNNSEKQQPSKLIDYGLSKRPIIEVSKDFTNYEVKILDEFLAANYSKQKIIEDINQFSSKNVCANFIKLYEKKTNAK